MRRGQIRWVELAAMVLMTLVAVPGRGEVPVDYGHTTLRFAPETLRPWVAGHPAGSPPSSISRRVRRLPAIRSVNRTSIDPYRFASVIEAAKNEPAEDPRADIDDSSKTTRSETDAMLSDELAAAMGVVELPPQRASPLDDFSVSPLLRSSSSDLVANALVYAGKRPQPTQDPWIQWGREFYGTGITPPASRLGGGLFGPYNPVRGKAYLYGDLRTGIAGGRNAGGRTDNLASRLNLDADWQITDSERFHAFVGPLDDGGAFTRYEFVAGDLRFRNEIDFTPATAFFEGDLGRLYGGWVDRPSPAEIPVAIGLVPLLFQNGIWMEDAVTGVATAIPSRHSNLLNWSNYDATFFAVFDQLNSLAFGADENAAQAFGTAWFIEAYGGYIESGYAFVRDRNNEARSYHNVTTSFTRRYLDRISNSVRVIVNAGQNGPQTDRTADGVLLLIENSWITANPLRVVPYLNAFVGWDSPQSVARAGVSGGILRNTGINFDTDGLNGYATLDPTGNNTAGFSLGMDLLGDHLERQWIVETTYLTRHNGPNRLVRGDQFALGTRYQFPISHRTLIRTDAMYGWRGNQEDVYGTRLEWRWKF